MSTNNDNRMKGKIPDWRLCHAQIQNNAIDSGVRPIHSDNGRSQTVDCFFLELNGVQIQYSTSLS